MDYQELIDDHDQIDELARQLETVAKGDRSDEPLVDQLLSKLESVVALHLHKEDSFIYPRIAASVDPANAQDLITEFEQIKHDWQAYLGAWKDGQAREDWEAFRTSTIGMLARLRVRVMKETGLLYGMAMREGLIDMRPAGQ